MAAVIPVVLPALLDFLKPAIAKFFPDPAKADEFRSHIADLAAQQQGEELKAGLQLALGQQDINKIEAANPRLWVSGWRPAIGWTCAVALFTYYVPYALAATGLWVAHCIQSGALSPRPDLGITDLIGLVGTMLGMATLRTGEKFKGVAAS